MLVILGVPLIVLGKSNFKMLISDKFLVIYVNETYATKLYVFITTHWSTTAVTYVSIYVYICSRLFILRIFYDRILLL